LTLTSTAWSSPEGLRQLLVELVQIPSITGTAAERSLPEQVAQWLRERPFYQERQEWVQLHPAEDGRPLLTALWKREAATRKTVVLLSHFDVVGVEDYGPWKHLAFRPEELTRAFRERSVAHPQSLPADVRADLADGEWLFGRGVMDMKCGLAQHMALLERAAAGEFDGNLLLVTVNDEEVNSVGMRAAVPVLLQLAEEHELEYVAMLNSEPMFSPFPGDRGTYVYSGSIGKILPGFLCAGRETHVGEPFAGLNANLLAAMMAEELELNTAFCEQVAGEVTPPPVTQILKDLKTDYNVQIPLYATVLCNLFLYERPVDELTELLRSAAERVARRVEATYAARSQTYATLTGRAASTVQVRVQTYQELHAYAVQTYGTARVEAVLATVTGAAQDGASEVVTDAAQDGASEALKDAATAGASEAVKDAATAGASEAVTGAATAGASEAVTGAATAGASEAVTGAATAGVSETVIGAVQEESLRGRDERALTIAMAEALCGLCRELAPMIVLFYAPPFYPAVCSREHPRVRRVLPLVQAAAQEPFGVHLQEVAYFAGISDLSYAGLHVPAQAMEPLAGNMPLWQRSYALPLEELAALQQQFDAPVLNIGPIGRDAHKWTERLDVEFAFQTLPILLGQAVQWLLDE